MTDSYVGKIWAARYFWSHLSLSDLRSRWRRSFFGILWTIIQPLGMTLLLAIVFGRIFNSSLGEYAPYVLSGMIVWECVIGCVVGGALSFVQADAYIKQYKHPLAIYTLRTVLTNLAVLSLASTSLVIWVVISSSGERVSWTWLAAMTIFPILGIALWPLSTLLAYIAARFRDLPHALGLVMQAAWFISPIYFEPKVFRGGGLDFLVDYNPLFHLMEIVRAPLLRGNWPTVDNYLFCFLTILALFILAWLVGRKAEKQVIFYL